MYRMRKRLFVSAFFMLLLMLVAGCSAGHVTSSGGVSESSLAAPAQEQEREISREKQLEGEEKQIEGKKGQIEVQEEQVYIERPAAKVDEEREAKPGTENEPLANAQKQGRQEQETSQTQMTTETSEPKVVPEASPAGKVEEKQLEQSVSITILGPQGENYIILEKKEVAWQEGDTVLEVLKRVTREEGIHLEYRGRNRTAYVEGIDNLYEFDRGPSSGWVYRVNGVFSSQSAGTHLVEAGDFIEWLYTLDMGKDVGDQRQNAEGK